MYRLLVLLTLLTGCPSGDDTGDDTSDAGIDGSGDDGSGASGIVLTYTSRPDIPGEVDDGLLVDSMRFGLTSLRLGSDAATVPVARTELAWSGGSAPTADAIDDAPAGVYSSLEATISAPAAAWAFEIGGTIDGDRYVIRDSAPLPLFVGFGLGLTLDPGGTLAIEVRVRIEDVIEDIDFRSLPSEGGTLTLGPGNGQLASVRAAIVENITVSDD